MIHETSSRKLNYNNMDRRCSSLEDVNVKVKGLLKGLRFISHVFAEGEEKNEMMRIGFPTDVKHVAHIGSNSSAASTPSWMKEFREANGGTETVVAYAQKAEAPISSTEESVESSSRQAIKTKSKESKQPRRRKVEGKPIKQRTVETTSTRVPGEETNKPKKTRRRRIKKKDDLKSSSSNPRSALSTDESGSLDKSKCDSIYGSANESSNDEGSTKSYATVASHLREV